MKNTLSTQIRFGAATLAIAATLGLAGTAAAQTGAPPAQPAPDAGRLDQRSIDRGHRLAHPPRSARSGSAGRVRRPRRHRSHRPHLHRRSAAAPAELAAARSTAGSTTAAISATRPTAAASAPARPRSTCAISARAACSCSSTACATSTAPRPSGVPGSVDLNSIPESMIEPGRGAAGRRLCDLRLRRDFGRGQHHHPPPPERAARLRRSSASSARATASTRIINCPGATPTTTAAPASSSAAITSSRTGSARATATSRCSRRRAPPPATRACSSGTPLGRFIVLGNSDLTLRHPVLTGRPSTIRCCADYRQHFKASPPPTASTSRRSTSSRCRWNAMAASLNFTQEIEPTTSTSALHARLQPAQFVEPGGAAAAVRRPRCRQRQPARQHHDRRHQPVQSVRTLRSGRNLDGTPNGQIPNYAFIGRRVVENGPRRYDQTRRHLLCAPAPSKARSRWPATTGTGT